MYMPMSMPMPMPIQRAAVRRIGHCPSGSVSLHPNDRGHAGSVTVRHPRKGASQNLITNRCQRVAPTAEVDHWSPKSRNRSQDAASP